MRIIETKVYEFKELSEDAKLAAIEAVQNDEHYLSYDWWDSCYEWFNDKYGDLFNDIKPSFSGFLSQGDGASFLYSGIDNEKMLEKWMDEEKVKGTRRKLYEEYLEISSKGYRSCSHYVHENTVSHTIDFDLSHNNSLSGAYNVMDFVSELECDFEYWLDIFYKDICRELYRTLYSEHDFLMSRESIEEHLIGNDLEFEKDGKQW